MGGIVKIRYDEHGETEIEVNGEILDPDDVFDDKEEPIAPDGFMWNDRAFLAILRALGANVIDDRRPNRSDA